MRKMGRLSNSQEKQRRVHYEVWLNLKYEISQSEHKKARHPPRQPLAEQT